MLSCYSHIQLFTILWIVACQTSLSMGFSRQEYWNGFPCSPPGDLPDPGIEPTSLISSALWGGFITTEPTSSLKIHRVSRDFLLILGTVLFKKNKKHWFSCIEAQCRRSSSFTEWESVQYLFPDTPEPTLQQSSLCPWICIQMRVEEASHRPQVWAGPVVLSGMLARSSPASPGSVEGTCALAHPTPTGSGPLWFWSELKLVTSGLQPGDLYSAQFSSVAQSHLILGHPMDCSTPECCSRLQPGELY